MNRKLILRLLGAIMCIEAIAMIPSFVVSLLHLEGGDAGCLANCIVLEIIPGALLWLFIRPTGNTHLRLKEGFLVVALGWILLSIFGALPFVFSGMFANFSDALFEAVSGFTTTGATVVTDFSGIPKGIMFWRASTHWIGGMGVLVLTLALLPKLTGRTSHLVRAESPGPSLSKIVPHTGSTAKILYLIYLLLTILEFLALLLCGLSPYDAALHAMSNAGTGGFSNYAASIAAFDSVAVDVVITVFMFLFGVNFALYYKFLIGERFKAFYRDEEFRSYFILVVLLILSLTVSNLSFYKGNFATSLRYSSFSTCSLISTTGFATSDFNLWPVTSHALVFFAMFIGSCAGSTAGGLKVVRFLLIGKMARRTIRRTVQPRKVEVVRLDGKAVDEDLLHQILVFSVVYLFLVIFGGLLLSFDGKYDLLSHLSASLTCVSNVGPAFNAFASSFSSYCVWGKLICCFLMLAGRLELFPVLILFTGSVWQKY